MSSIEEGRAPLLEGPQAGKRPAGCAYAPVAAVCNRVSSGIAPLAGCACVPVAAVRNGVSSGISHIADWAWAEGKPRKELEWKVKSVAEEVVEELMELGRSPGLVVGLIRLGPQAHQPEHSQLSFGSDISDGSQDGGETGNPTTGSEAAREVGIKAAGDTQAARSEQGQDDAVTSGISTQTPDSEAARDVGTHADVGTQAAQDEEDGGEEGEREEIRAIRAQCRANGLGVTAALATKVMCDVVMKRYTALCEEQRFLMGSKYQECTTDEKGDLLPLDRPEDLQGAPPVRGVNTGVHAWPWTRPPRSLVYIEVAVQDVNGEELYTAVPDTVTLAKPQNPEIFPGSNFLIAVTDSEWTWQMFMSVWSVMQFTVSTTLALQQALTLPTAGFGIVKGCLYVVVVVGKVLTPFFFATQDHTPDADLPNGYHRIGHRFRDLFCQAIGIRSLVRNAHRALTPEYLGRTGLDRLAKNVGSRLGCRVPLVYLGPCANQLWKESEHMKHRLIWTFGADGVLFILSVLLARASNSGAASRVIGFGNSLFMFFSVVGLGVQLWRYCQGLSQANKYATDQLIAGKLREGARDEAEKTRKDTEKDKDTIGFHLLLVLLFWAALIVVLAVRG